MRKIVASVFITLDGVVEAPGSGNTTLPDHKGWSEPFMSPELAQTILEEMAASDAMLLGRVTYEGFAAFWPSMPADDPFASHMNGVNKYVVSTTLDDVEWQNSHLIKGDIADEIRKLKQAEGKNIAVVGSGTLVQFLLQEDLIDELVLSLCPVVLGTGKRLFDDVSAPTTLRLADTTVYDTGMVVLTYQM